MKKVIIIIIALFALAILAAGLLVLWPGTGTSPQQTTSTSTATFPNAGSAQGGIVGGGSGGATPLTIVTADGGAVATKDFLHDPATGAYPTPGYYYLGYHTPVAGAADPTATTSAPYIIEYISSGNYFNIEILREPIGEVRVAAEQYLGQHLGLGESDLCRLNYMVSVPYSVNQIYAGENLGFSFCPGSVKLPQ